MFDVDKISDFEEPTPGGPALPDKAAWQHSVEVSAVKEEYDAAMKVVDQTLDEYKKAGNPKGEAAAVLSKAKVLHAQGKNEPAKAAAQSALEKYRTTGGTRGEAACLHVLARIDLDLKKYDEEEKKEILAAVDKVANEALDLFKTVDDKKGQASVLNTIAKAQFARGLFDEAIQSCEKAQLLFQDSGDQDGQAAVLLTKSLIHLFWGDKDWVEAAKTASKAIDLCKKVTKPSAQHREADAWLMVCAASIPLMKSEEAVQAAKSALSLMETLGGNYKLALALRAMAFTQAVVGNMDEAISRFQQAQELVDTIGDKQLKASVMLAGSVVHRVKIWSSRNGGTAGGDSQEQAVWLGKQAVELYTELDNYESAALTRIELAQAMMMAGNVAEALAEASSAKDFFESMGNSSGEAIALMTLAEGMHIQGGQAETAYGCAKRSVELFTKAGGAVEGSKAAGELADVLEAELRTQKETGQWGAIDHGTYQGEPAGFGAISRAIYTKLFSSTMYMPDRPYEVMLDAPVIQAMDMVNASVQRAAAAPKKAPPKRQMGEGGKPVRQEGQVLRPVPLRDERTEAPAVRQAIIGSDMLGGRSWDVPEDVHARMVEMATQNLIPKTMPEQRFMNSNKRPTFYGAPEWRDAVKMGYIHPEMQPPSGFKWRKVTMGWKLLQA